jgi:hypothetical protein
MFATKPPDAWEGLDVIVEECSNQSTASQNITLADLADADDVQRRQFTLDLCTSQTPGEESQFHKARVCALFPSPLHLFYSFWLYRLLHPSHPQIMSEMQGAGQHDTHYSATWCTAGAALGSHRARAACQGRGSARAVSPARTPPVRRLLRRYSSSSSSFSSFLVVLVAEAVVLRGRRACPRGGALNTSRALSLSPPCTSLGGILGAR